MKLQFFSGDKKKEGFINIDKYNLNADIICDAMDFEAARESVDEIYCHHGIEHLSYPEVQIFLKRCFSWLKQGGKLTLIQPDFDGIIKMYPQNSGDVKILLYGDLKGVGWEHKSVWNEKWLEGELKKAGFNNITFYFRRVNEITAIAIK